MDEYLKKYKIMIIKRKIFTIAYFTAVLLIFVGALACIIIGAIRSIDFLIPLGVILSIIAPVVLFFLYLILQTAFLDKKRKRLDTALENSGLSADEILIMGNKLNIDLFGVAVSKRVRELGLKGVPEWCVRDGVLPTERDCSL